MTRRAFDIAGLGCRSLYNLSGTVSEKTGQTLRFECLNMNHFVRDDVYICGSDYNAHVRR